MADWQPVEPGHVIPAGQPYMVVEKGSLPDVKIWSTGQPRDMPIIGLKNQEWFVDSSWRPPLELPTKPTWGIVVYDYQAYTEPYFGKWELRKYANSERKLLFDVHAEKNHSLPVQGVLDFVECTPEQVARIEGAR